MTKMELYQQANQLNNKLNSAGYKIDIVSIMAFMSIEECQKHLEYYNNQLNKG